MVNNWQYLCQKLDAEVALNDCTDVGNEASIVQELTEEEIVSEIFVERNGIWQQCNTQGKKEDNSNDENVIFCYKSSQQNVKLMALCNDQGRHSRPHVGEQ
jgi:N-acetyl-beta-hexosaminidase